MFGIGTVLKRVSVNALQPGDRIVVNLSPARPIRYEVLQACNGYCECLSEVSHCRQIRRFRMDEVWKDISGIGHKEKDSS